MKIELELEKGWETDSAIGFKGQNYGSPNNKDGYGRQKLIWIPKTEVERIDDKTYLVQEKTAIEKGLI